MKIERNKDDICLLCQVNKADQTGSHYTPAGIIKRVIGERDYEEIYSINSFKATTNQYFGRSNLANKNPKRKKPEHVDDYIFCKECEHKLGIIESECNNQLIVLSDLLVEGKIAVLKSKKGNDYINFKNPRKNILITYFYSIIWRQCLQQKNEFGTIFINEKFQEILRNIVYYEIGKTLKEITVSSDFENYPSLILLTTYHTGDHTNNYINPNPSPTNPELFFIGPYHALIFHTKDPSLGFTIRTALQESIVDDEIIINHATDGVIGIISNESWDRTKSRLTELEVKRYLHTMTSRLVQAKRIPYNVASYYLHFHASKYLPKYPDDYIKCLDIALRSLLK